MNTSLFSGLLPPDSWTGPLNDLLNTLPTLNDLCTALSNLINTLFNALKGEVNSTFNAAQPHDDIGAAGSIAQISAVTLFGLTVVVAVVSALIEWYQFRNLQRTIDEIRERWTDPATPRATSLPTRR